MIAAVLINSCNFRMMVTFKDHETGERVLQGQINEFINGKNKSYNRLIKRQIKDFYINFESIVIWL